MQIEPWNFKADDSRTADSLPTFIIFCEDQVSEPVYFKFFETERIKINIVGNQKSSISNVVNAVKYCTEKGLLENCNGILRLKGEDPQVWCVFDLDAPRDGSSPEGQNAAFNTAIHSATSSGFQIAWSNDAFELWILLHFEDVDYQNPMYKHRDGYYDRLSAIFKDLEDPNEELQKALKYHQFSYKESLKREKNFRSIVRPAIVSSTLEAIKRARNLEAKFNDAAVHYHEKVPCTLVHHLVEELLRLGKKF